MTLETNYSTTTPTWRPEFIREIRERAEDGGILAATHDILVRDNVTVRAGGELDAVAGHAGGLLFIGNHNRQFEFVALMDVLHQLGRTSMKNVVKFYVEAQVAWALGQVGTDITLPVYPRLLTRDRSNIFNSELGSRIVFHRLLQGSQESSDRNKMSLQVATDELSKGGVVNIFPCGTIANNMEMPWREGVGRIVRAVPEADRDDVLVVPYHADNINRFRLLAALTVRGRGPLARSQTIDVTFGHTQSITDIMEALPDESQAMPDAITDELRRNYVESFAN